MPDEVKEACPKCGAAAQNRIHEAYWDCDSNIYHGKFNDGYKCLVTQNAALREKVVRLEGGLAAVGEVRSAAIQVAEYIPALSGFIASHCIVHTMSDPPDHPAYAPNRMYLHLMKLRDALSAALSQKGTDHAE